MTDTDMGEFNLPKSRGSHAGDTKPALHRSLPLLIFSMLCTLLYYCIIYYIIYILIYNYILLSCWSRIIPVSPNWESCSLSVCATCCLNFAFFCSFSVPPTPNFGFKIAVRLDCLLPSNVSSWNNKTLTPPKYYTKNRAWRAGLCSFKFTALLSSSKISSSAAERLSQAAKCLVHHSIGNTIFSFW